jgi:hypothetical protein
MRTTGTDSIMQISAAPTPAQQMTRPQGPNPGNLLYVGVKRSVDEGEVYRRDVRLYRSDRAGSATGYSSLENAIRAAKYMTGDPGFEGGLGGSAVAAVTEGARYVLYRVRERFAHPVDGFRTPGHRANFERVEEFEARAERPYYEHAALRALIDGAHVQRFLPGAVEPGVRP